MTRTRRQPYETIQPATIGHLRLLRVKNVGIDLDGHRVFVGSTEVRLSPKEFELLHVLLENAGRVVSRRELLDTVWSTDRDNSTKTIEVHIRRLRCKLGPPGDPPLIRAVRGIGYIFDVDAQDLTRKQ
jgi:DNA-binding response OmpR family regulator